MTDNERNEPKSAKRVGRPIIYDERLTVQIPVLFTPTQAKAIRTQAKAEKLKAAALIRAIVSEALG